MKNLMWLTGILLSSVLFTGCGSNKSDDHQACPAGTYYSGGLCYAAGGVTTSANYYYNSGFYADNYSGTTSLSITNAAKMKDFFKLGMGVCDRAANNYGQSSCDYYTSGSLDIIIQFPNAGTNTAIATIIARPKQNSYFNYQAQIPSGWGLVGAAVGLATGVWFPDPKYYTGVEKNPLQLNMEVSVINNSAGFEGRGYGPTGSGMQGTTLAIQVPQGKIEDASFNFNFLIGGTASARGTMKRCQTMNCGL
ncbi:MAG: hypothetical protein H7328_02560 [Bdellovibrio sp.]|nr:hypothetical protein [Bdellovibrio sp.]